MPNTTHITVRAARDVYWTMMAYLIIPFYAQLQAMELGSSEDGPLDINQSTEEVDRRCKEEIDNLFNECKEEPLPDTPLFNRIGNKNDLKQLERMSNRSFSELFPNAFTYDFAPIFFTPYTSSATHEDVSHGFCLENHVQQNRKCKSPSALNSANCESESGDTGNTSDIPINLQTMFQFIDDDLVGDC